jgi:hypothetical protein
MMRALKLILARWVLRAYFGDGAGFGKAYFDRDNRVLGRMGMKALWRARK